MAGNYHDKVNCCKDVFLFKVVFFRFIAVFYLNNNPKVLPGFDHRLNGRVGNHFAENSGIYLNGIQVYRGRGNRQFFLQGNYFFKNLP